MHFCYSSSILTASGACLYTFCHANIFHLILNLWALSAFRPRKLTLLVGLAIATIVPIFSAIATPTCGASAAILAMYARRYVAWRKPWVRIFILNIILLLITFLYDDMAVFNAMAHLMSFSIGYVFWTIYYKLKTINTWNKN